MEHTFKILVLHEGYYSDSGAEITDENGFVIIDARQTAILLGYADKLGIDCPSDDERARLEFTKEQQAANARRIVACVNACAGLSDAVVSHGLVPASRHSTVAHQRDQLLAALRKVLELSNEAGADLHCLLEGDTKKARLDARDAEIHLLALNDVAKAAIAAVESGHG
ncbi:hypothetical protein [Chromobacterium subtsugae]|uniref:hypothetical protein n=1 Tax=Chromobacterium subtsugae TaxID=251747 RepID=UPI0007F8FB96|nr:hypothetical protein [Chromobacterium subtsugae]OBU84564.1 hypothetical protein MY55_21265 [Chromobacterium subtsugae]